LTLGDGNIETAIALYYDAQEDTNDTMPGDDEQQDMTPPQQQQAGGARTLAGEYVPPAPTSTADEPSRAPASNRPAQRGVAGARTLRDLQGGGGGGHGPGHGHAHDDEDDDEDDQDDEQQDFFAGGEKSGLAVQNPGQSNPRDQINNILRRARQ
jgi:UBX domain-containing protein 1